MKKIAFINNEIETKNQKLLKNNGKIRNSKISKIVCKIKNICNKIDLKICNFFSSIADNFSYSKKTNIKNKEKKIEKKRLPNK